MTTNTEQQLAYLQGWTDCQAQIQTALWEVVNRIQAPAAPRVRKACQECGGDLEIGEPAEYVGRDAYMLSVYKHLRCPQQPLSGEVELGRERRA